MKALLTILAIVGIGYLGLCAWLFFKQSSLVYYPRRELEATPADYQLPYEEIVIPLKNNGALHGWYISADSANETIGTIGTILFAHGNGGNLSHRLDLMAHWRSLGFDVFGFDYQGYGQSTGAPSEEATYDDIRAGWEYLITERKIAPKRILVLGRSLGAAVASHLVAELSQPDKPAPAGLVLEAPFTSIPEMGARLYPFLPVRLLSRIIYDNQAHVRKIHIPVLIMQGVDDSLVPITMGREVFASANEPKQFVSLPGGHEDTYILGREKYSAALLKFARETFPGN